MKIRQHFAVSLLALCAALSPLPAAAQLFGPSDEEKAAEKAHEDGQDSAIQQADDRIHQLEDRVRNLTESLSQATGANEELSHRLQLQNDKIDQMQKDFAYRLCTLSAQQLGAGDQMNCAAAGTPSAASQPYAPPQGAPRPGDTLPPVGGGNFNSGPPPSDNQAYNDNGPVRGRPPGVLGTLPAGTPPPPPGGTPQQAGNSQYDAAMNLMSRAQYDEAAAAFRSYADANPSDTDLSPQAIYWVGNISFIRQDYATAARSFAEVIKKYPKAQRAPDAMLKLAQSFLGMGQKSEGCTTLGLIKTKYPNASPQTLGNAANLRKTACSK
ncbi:MAG TPA: tol-pal system protein YbgF [Rhizomicrobium sp.]|nr:tol-pal system protein YbgF [Rhizomicrobium sp.]